MSFVSFSSFQSLSRVRLFVTPWITANQASLSITNSWSSLSLTSIESLMPSRHLIFCRPLLLLPPIPPSIRVFSNESTLCMRWPKYWSFSFSIIPSKEHPGLISFRMDWLENFYANHTRERNQWVWTHSWVALFPHHLRVFSVDVLHVRTVCFRLTVLDTKVGIPGSQPFPKGAAFASMYGNSLNWIRSKTFLIFLSFKLFILK